MMDIYIVQKEDTIETIASKYGVSVDRLIQDNGLIKTTNLVPGQPIVITYPIQSHIVQEGDTLASIADSYEITTMQLLQYNTFLSEREFIYPGESLVIRYDTKGRLATHGFLYHHIKRSTLTKTLPLLSYVSVFNYRVTEENTIITYGEDSDIIKLAIDYGTIPLLMISSIGLDGEPNIELIYELLLNKELQDKLTKEVTNIVKTKGYYGLNLMISNLNATNQQLYIDLFTSIASQLREEGLYFYITINLKVEEDSMVNSHNMLDYEAISSIVDGIVFLQYYWGTRPGAPKPVSNLSQLETYLDYVEARIPNDKIIIGLTLVGYDWELPYRPNRSRVSALSPDGVTVLAYNVNASILFDESSQTPYFNYSLYYPGGAVDHIVWYVDARSMNSILEINYENNIPGSGIWGIMVYNQQLWSLICSRFQIIKFLDK